MAILKLDDRDSSIVYLSRWHHGGVKAEFDKTTTYNGDPGSTAKLTFDGTSVAVFGTISPKKSDSIAPISSYSIDGAAPVEFKAAQTPDTQYSQQFFQSPTLPAGQHTLIITNKLHSDPTFLDFFLVDGNTIAPTPPPPQPTSASSSTTSSGASSSSSSLSNSSASSFQTTPPLGGSSQTTPPAASPFPTPAVIPVVPTQPSPATAPAGADGTPSSSSGGSPGGSDSNIGATKNSAAGAIAGGVVGAIIALALLALVAVYCRRRTRRRRRFGGFRRDDSFWRPMASEMTATTTTATSTPWPPPIPPARPIFPPPEITPPAPPPPPPSSFVQNPIYTTGVYDSEDSDPQTNPARASANTFASSFYVDDRAPQTEGYPSRSYMPPSQAMNMNNNPPNVYYAQ
ncbi:hypothetical protein GALMADRAFT_230300 [Galerina marginata CBS 339.88]|uniref:Uncharacterized protein n=1 Tax=Galerina marginata (strain CBS 339.88) TaxID=685588 RepID=A0A067SQL1_GALM3|nr:hypothetical protein GALMADRAFT_230300 [Galerina marginata CBS 339.88]